MTRERHADKSNFHSLEFSILDEILLLCIRNGYICVFVSAAVIDVQKVIVREPS
jgi:hypothetical protein